MTCLILNGKAVCCMLMGNFDEAESLLIEALNKVISLFFSVFFPMEIII
jgi:Coatomer epsilon subunit